MAKVKQKKSVQEMLEEAIVSKDQAPFAIPKNWCWVKLGTITEILAGGTPSRADKNYWGKGIPWVKISDMHDKIVVKTEEEITLDGLKNSSAKLLPKGTLLFSIFATIGAISILGIEACTNQAIVGLKLNPNVETSYIYFALFLLKDNIKLEGKGVAQKNINQSVLKGINVPIAPLAEQKRIVDKIELLFSRLDEAKDLIQKSLDEFEDRKSAILHKAFNGKLINNLEYSNKYLNEICTVITDGTHQTPKYTDQSGYVFLSSKNVRTGKINWDDVKYIPEELHEQLYSRIAPQLDDILLAKNGTTGIAAIVDKDVIFDIYVSLALLRPRKEVVDPKYLLYMINSPDTKEYFDASLKGIGVPNLHLKYIRNTLIPIPLDIKNQQEIVRILDEFFEKEDKSKELLDMIDQIEEMKKSILSRAFRGELGTHSDTDEPAIELLKNMLIEDNNVHCDKLEIAKRKDVVREKKHMGKTILEALINNGNRLTPEKLKQETELPIDEFYDKLKELIDLNKIREVREERESYLEAIHEDRSLKNK